MAKFSFRSFTFYKPSQLSENEYNGYSKIIESDSDYEINVPGLNFWTEFKNSFYVLGIFLIAGGAFDLVAELTSWEILHIGTFFSLMTAFWASFQFLFEFMSFLNTNFSKNRFYMKLTKRISKSSDYQDYLKRTRRMFK